MSNLPEWVEHVDDIGMSEQDGTRRLKKALSIAWEAMKSAEYYSQKDMEKVRDAMKRIEELGTNKLTD